jgi:hypothetical protein
MTSIYDQHDNAFTNVAAFVIAKDGKRVATIAFKFGNAVTAYVHWLGEPMVRGIARGGGYDRKSAACSDAARALAVPSPGADLLESDHREHWLEEYARKAGWTPDETGRLIHPSKREELSGAPMSASSWATAYALDHEDPLWRAFRDALTPDDGHGWDSRLRDAGFDVWQEV